MSYIFAILIFSLLIFIHEFGHFIAAKASGVQVNEFSIFMGPAIVKWQRGETLYAIRCIPFGGYCAMEGEDEDTDNPRSFQKAVWWKRLIILIAGSFMNLIAGFLLMVVVALPLKQLAVPQIASFEDFSTVDEAGGLQVGDEIIEIDGEKIYVQSNFAMMLTLNSGDTHDLVVLRDGKEVVLDDFVMQKHQTKDEQGNDIMLYGINFCLDSDLSFADKLDYAWNSSVDTVRIVRLSLQMLLTGKAKLSDTAGPVGIVVMMSDVAEQSDSAFEASINMLYFGAFISLNLGVMNMLPIPALDGGRTVGLLLTTAVEKITKKKVPAKIEGYIHGIGMIILLALMALILFKDVFTIFTR